MMALYPVEWKEVEDAGKRRGEGSMEVAWQVAFRPSEAALSDDDRTYELRTFLQTLRRFVALRQDRAPTVTSRKQMFEDFRFLAGRRVAAGQTTWRWWRRLVREGFLDAPQSGLLWCIWQLTKELDSMCKAVGRQRYSTIASWMRRDAAADASSIFRWIRDCPPFATGAIPEGRRIFQGSDLPRTESVPCPSFLDNVMDLAAPFTRAWTTAETTLAESFCGRGEFSLDLSFDPDRVKRIVGTFSDHTAYGAEGAHPCHLALLSAFVSLSCAPLPESRRAVLAIFTGSFCSWKASSVVW